MTDQPDFTAPAAIVPPAPKLVDAHPMSRGVDVSSWQHPHGKAIDWKAVAESGVTFAMIKATQGVDYVNPYLVEDFEGAHAAGLICGGYHFYEAGVDPSAQGAHFVASMVGRITELGCYIDWEPSEMPDWQVNSAYNELLTKIEETRKPCGLYADLTWHATFVRLNLPIRRFWLADPSATQVPQGATIWQRPAVTVPGIEDNTDIDELLSVRGIPLPRPPKAAEQPFVAAGEAIETASEPAEGSAADNTADAAAASEPLTEAAS